MRFGRDKVDGDQRTYSRFEVYCQRGSRSGQTCLVEWKELKDWGICIYSPQDWGEVRFRWAEGHLRSRWLLPGGRPATRARLRGSSGTRVLRLHLTENDDGELIFVKELGNIDAEGVVTRVEVQIYSLRDSSESVPVRCRRMSF